MRLNVTYARRIFGDSPVCIYDSPSEHNAEIKAIADEHGCAYFCERVNRGHFSGDLMACSTAIAFAKQHGCDIGVKINQRTILLSPEIPGLIAKEFENLNVTLLSPDRYPEASIIHPESKFHHRFPAAVDLMCFRAKDWDAQGIADDYSHHWKTDPSKYACYSEVFWAHYTKDFGPDHSKPRWITEHTAGRPFMYLRKIQNTEADYSRAAIDAGLPVGGYKTAEWSALKPGQYSPVPRA